MKPFVYGLVDPTEPKHVRYVGMASVNAARPYSHARHTKNQHLANWIQKLKTVGRIYEVLILEELPETGSRDLLGFVEQCYIRSLREIGHRLTNIAEGGWTGDIGIEARERQSKSLKQYYENPENRKRASEGAKKFFSDSNNRQRHRDLMRNPEVLAKLSDKAATAWKDPDIRSRQSEAIRAAWDEETRQRQSVLMKEKHNTPESIVRQSLAAKKHWETRDRTVSEAQRAKLSVALKGNQHTLGKKFSEETKAKMSRAQKARRERERKVL